MTSARITTGPGGLMALTASAAQREVMAYFYTFTKAQTVARKASPDPTTDAYFDAMTRSLASLGWDQTKAPSFRIAPVSPPVSPLTAIFDAVLRMIMAAIPGHSVDVASVNRWLAIGEQALRTPSPDVAAQLDTWWDSTDAGAARVLTVGPLTDILGVPWVGAAHVSLAYAGTGWRSLLEPSDSYALSVSSLVMALDWQIYDRIEADLKASVDADLADRIASADLDFTLATLEIMT